MKMLDLLLGPAVTVPVAMFQNKHESTDEMFSQRGVTVNYAEKTVVIKDQTFDVSQIRRFWVSGEIVTFEVDDMSSPLKTIKFTTVKNANTFLSRFEIAYSKAQNLSE